MKRKERTKACMIISNWKRPFRLHALKIFQPCMGPYLPRPEQFPIRCLCPSGANTVETRYRTASQSGPSRNTDLLFPKYSLIHIMYYQIQKVDRPAIRDTDHPFSVPNHKRKNGPAIKDNLHFYSYIYASIKGPAAAGFTNGTSCSWIH